MYDDVDPIDLLYDDSAEGQAYWGEANAGGGWFDAIGNGIGSAISNPGWLVDIFQDREDGGTPAPVPAYDYAPWYRRIGVGGGAAIGSGTLLLLGGLVLVVILVKKKR